MYLEMNFASSFLVQSDQLEVVLHLLLAPVDTVMKLVEHEFALRQDPNPEGLSSGLQQDRGRTGASLALPRSLCNPECQ